MVAFTLNFRHLMMMMAFPALMVLLCRGIWHWVPAVFLATAGGFFAMLGISVPLILLVIFLQTEIERAHRLRALLLLAVLSGVSCVISWNMLFSFGGFNASGEKVLVFKNTSAQTLVGMKLFWGRREMALPTLTSRERRVMTLFAPSEVQARVTLKSPDGAERSAQFLVGPENKRIQLLIDWSLNVLVEVQ
jgi:hypothetical protein